VRRLCDLSSERPRENRIRAIRNLHGLSEVWISNTHVGRIVDLEASELAFSSGSEETIQKRGKRWKQQIHSMTWNRHPKFPHLKTRCCKSNLQIHPPCQNPKAAA
jgi:hypothetical protein